MDGPAPKIPPPSKFRFSVKAGKKNWPSADFVFDHMNTDYRVEFFWCPEGGRVAYLVHHESATDGSGIDFSVAFGPAQGPRVQVLGAKGMTFDDYLGTQLSLELVGLYPIAIGEAQAPRPKPVIFAANGFEAEARKILEELPDAKIPHSGLGLLRTTNWSRMPRSRGSFASARPPTHWAGRYSQASREEPPASPGPTSPGRSAASLRFAALEPGAPRLFHGTPRHPAHPGRNFSRGTSPSLKRASRRAAWERRDEQGCPSRGRARRPRQPWARGLGSV